MNERIAVFDAMPNSCPANSGTTVRSMPTMPPTKALITTSSKNCCQFALRPSWSPFSFPCGVVVRVVLGDSTAVCSCLKLDHVLLWKYARFVEPDDSYQFSPRQGDQAHASPPRRIRAFERDTHAHVTAPLPHRQKHNKGLDNRLQS